MKVISLWQPWATLWVTGLKQIETRHWSTNHRGPLIVHAAQKKDRACQIAYERIRRTIRDFGTPEQKAKELQLPDYKNLGFGGLVGMVNISAVAMIDMEGTHAVVNLGSGIQGKVKPVEFASGNYDVGRFAWLTSKREQTEFIPEKGKQGFWQWRCATNGCNVEDPHMHCSSCGKPRSECTEKAF